jgi:hypothetical protein
MNANPRGPYTSATYGMTPKEAAAWFERHARDEYDRRFLKTSYGDQETRYVNSKFRCSGFTTRSGLRQPATMTREWYRQASFSGNEWGVT